MTAAQRAHDDDCELEVKTLLCLLPGVVGKVSDQPGGGVELHREMHDGRGHPGPSR